jgi:hypothetical protein
MSPGRGADQKRVRWGVALPDGLRLADPQHADLLAAVRQFLWSMTVDLPRYSVHSRQHSRTARTLLGRCSEPAGGDGGRGSSAADGREGDGMLYFSWGRYAQWTSLRFLPAAIRPPRSTS